jgi:hypothetical protein
MKKITVENYEAWFLDYVEGNLDNAAVLELESFLNLHPNLKAALEQSGMVSLASDSSVFEGKQSLKKFQFDEQRINDITFEDFCIAAHEGILSVAKQEELSNFLQTSTTLSGEYIAYGKAFLKPESVLFPGKQALYQKQRTIRFRSMIMWGLVAAGLVLLVSIYLGMFGTKETQNHEVVTVPEKQILPQAENKSLPLPRAAEAIVEKQQLAKVTNKSRDGEKTPAINSGEMVREETQALDALKPKNADVLQVADVEPVSDSLNETIYVPQQAIEEVAQTGAAGEDKQKLLSLVENGIDKINKVTHTHSVALAHKTNSKGEIKAFSIKLGFLGFERKKSR